MYECVCDIGYNGDGFNCVLEPNCHNDRSLCPQNSQCHQSNGEYQCICDLGKLIIENLNQITEESNDCSSLKLKLNSFVFVGFVLQGDICVELPRFDTGFLLLGQGLAIVRVPLNGGKGYPVTMSSVSHSIYRLSCLFNNTIIHPTFFLLHSLDDNWC